ncbi:cold-shock protein [Streptomyces sp. NPDC048442]|uniref:cold-shock protein n=1 Tax=Streptomyces sp. NPDC048442 TaxID=3154823 RepID=UPI00343C8F4F
MATGKVKSFCSEEGFGHITQDDGGPDAFVHFTAIQGSVKELHEGDIVSYSLVQGQKGPQAEDVFVEEA